MAINHNIIIPCLVAMLIPPNSLEEFADNLYVTPLLNDDDGEKAKNSAPKPFDAGDRFHSFMGRSPRGELPNY